MNLYNDYINLADDEESRLRRLAVKNRFKLGTT